MQKIFHRYVDKLTHLAYIERIEGNDSGADIRQPQPPRKET